MKMFDSARDLAKAIGVRPDDDYSFPEESDWGIYRDTGYGRDGEKVAGSSPSPTRRRTRGGVVAFDIDEEGQRTGRCLALAGPYPAAQEMALHKGMWAQPWRRASREVDVEHDLVPWLAERSPLW